MIAADGLACGRRRGDSVPRAAPALLPRRGGQRWLDDHPPGITHLGLVARLTAAAAGTTRAAPTRHRPASRFWALHRGLAFLAFRQPRRARRKALGTALAGVRRTLAEIIELSRNSSTRSGTCGALPKTMTSA